MAALLADDGEGGASSSTATIPPWAGRRGGYTPFEYVGFPPDGSAEEITHEITVTVTRPRSLVFEAWTDRLFVGEWASLLGQAVLHADDAALASYFFFYRWGTLPVLELYTSTRREVVPGEAILERAVDGWAFAAGAFFADGPADGGGEPSSTTVTLRVAYALPSNLADAVGAAGVYAHVDDILRSDMATMAEVLERDETPAALAAARKAEAALFAARAAEFAGKTGEEVLAEAAAGEWEGLYDEEMDAGFEAAPAAEGEGGGGGA